MEKTIIALDAAEMSDIIGGGRGRKARKALARRKRLARLKAWIRRWKSRKSNTGGGRGGNGGGGRGTGFGRP